MLQGSIQGGNEVQHPIRAAAAIHPRNGFTCDQRVRAGLIVDKRDRKVSFWLSVQGKVEPSSNSTM